VAARGVSAKASVAAQIGDVIRSLQPPAALALLLDAAIVVRVGNSPGGSLCAGQVLRLPFGLEQTRNAALACEAQTRCAGF